MRLEIAGLFVFGFLVYNAYKDNQYTKMMQSMYKYHKLVLYAGAAWIGYRMMKTSPDGGRNMLLCANDLVQFLPVDRTALRTVSSVVDWTQGRTSGGPRQGASFLEDTYQYPPRAAAAGAWSSFAEGGGGDSGGMPMMHKHKRCVSETKKKYVAARQQWTCDACREQLDHTYEIDHRIRLEFGGGNDVGNLVALCRNCHGRKTAAENM